MKLGDTAVQCLYEARSIRYPSEKPEFTGTPLNEGSNQHELAQIADRRPGGASGFLKDAVRQPPEAQHLGALHSRQACEVKKGLFHLKTGLLRDQNDQGGTLR
jgi:hypothetical protein